MDYCNYQVVAKRISAPWFGVRTFYVPKLRTLNANGEYHYESFLNEEELPNIWGFDCEDDAWEKCFEHFYAQERDTYVSGGIWKEDFHTDG